MSMLHLRSRTQQGKTREMCKVPADGEDAWFAKDENLLIISSMVAEK
jgi:hypothetical protein